MSGIDWVSPPVRLVHGCMGWDREGILHRRIEYIADERLFFPNGNRTRVLSWHYDGSVEGEPSRRHVRDIILIEVPE